MAYWLLKEEPDHYAWSDFVRDGGTEWSGVHNALALQQLRKMVPGDRGLFYHTGSERACVGLLRVVGRPRPDPSDARGSWQVRVVPDRPLRRPISLAELRADPALAGLELFRITRLSIVPLSADQWTRLLSHEDARTWPPEPVATATAAGRGRATASPRGRTVARRTR